MTNAAKGKGEFLGLRLRPWGMLTAAGALSGVGTFVGFFGGLWWPLDLFSHFRAQYFLVLAMIAVILGIGRKRRPALILGAVSLINLGVILPLYFGGSPSDAPEDSSSLRAMLLNVNAQLGDPLRVLRAVEETDPDFLILEEINSEWMQALAPLESSHPYRIVRTRGDNFGIGLFSKTPLARAEIVYVGDAYVPSVIAAVEIDGRTLNIFATHPPPPGSRQSTHWRDDQLASIPDFLRDLSPPILLIGDLNVTPWSYHYRKLLKGTGLRDSSRGMGLQPTWPADIPLLWIPIDHCLYSDGIEILGRRTGPDVGSDHFPLIVDFQLVE